MSTKLPEDERKRRIVERTRKWRVKNREHHLAQSRKHRRKAYHAFPHRRLVSVYGFSEQEALKLVEVLDSGPCELCGRASRVVIDHNHQTGRFRGLLCVNCNNGLGRFQDSPELLEKAIVYLRERG